MDAEGFLKSIICTLSASPDFRTSIDNLAHLATRGLADWCGIYMFENEHIRRLAIAPVSRVESLFPLDLHAATGPAYVRRTGEQQLLANPDVTIAADLGLTAEELILTGGVRPSMCACLPAVARSRSIGAVVLMWTKSKQRIHEVELSLAASLAMAAAAAMDNSRLYSEAQEANRLKDEFVAMVSHELRTPLTPILGCVHLLRTVKLSDSNFDRALQMIERNARAQVQIVEDLLDVSRIVAGKLHLVMKSTAVVPVVEAAIGTIRGLAEAKGIAIITDFENLPAPIDADPHRLQQIVWNLLSNAVKFTPAEGRIEISVRSAGHQVEIRVTDTGVGIQPELLPYIFDRFRQGGNATSAMRTGLGLGLAIVRHLVELHNGLIEVGSAGTGQGTVFALRFPFATRHATAAASGPEN